MLCCLFRKLCVYVSVFVFLYVSLCMSVCMSISPSVNRKIGLNDAIIFEPLDLVERKNPNKVFATLCSLAEWGNALGRVQVCLCMIYVSFCLMSLCVFFFVCLLA